MFDTGNILYCKDFQFNNGDTPKDKYFIVLKREDDKIIIGCLPTRTNKVPSFVDIEHGCINKDERCFNCYLFKAKHPICDNGFCFDLPTFAYGDDLDTYDVKITESNYKLGVTYNVQGKLTQKEFGALIDCFKNSSSVKQKYRRKL